MAAIDDYLQAHLAGANAGSDLFDRSAKGTDDPQIGEALREIHHQVVAEVRELRQMMAALNVSENRLLIAGARLAERVGRLKPNGSLLHRTPLTDLVELEALRIAVAGKVSGWEALLAIADDFEVLDRDRLEALREQGRAQHDRLRELHAIAANRALA